MGSDPFVGMSEGLTAPLDNYAEITPHDTNELTNYCRAIMVGVSGTLEIVGLDDNAATLPAALAAGVWHPCRAKIIKSTGTTATDIVVGW